MDDDHKNLNNSNKQSDSTSQLMSGLLKKQNSPEIKITEMTHKNETHFIKFIIIGLLLLISIGWGMSWLFKKPLPPPDEESAVFSKEPISTPPISGIPVVTVPATPNVNLNSHVPSPPPIIASPNDDSNYREVEARRGDAVAPPDLPHEEPPPPPPPPPMEEWIPPPEPPRED